MADKETPPAEAPSAPTGGAGGAESQLSKYKRLLSMAKSSLESNQKLIGEKDGEITRLQQALKDQIVRQEKMRRVEGVNARGGGSGAGGVTGPGAGSGAGGFSKNGGSHGHDGAGSSVQPGLRPRNLLRRVDCEDIVWVLIEYEPTEGQHSRGSNGKLDANLSWASFKSEEALLEYIARIQGKPITAPVQCMKPDECARVQEEARSAVERVTEEFRRFKVKSEIIRKQKEAETQQLILKNTGIAASMSTAEKSSSMSLRAELERAMLNSAGLQDNGTAVDELTRLASQLNEKEAAWRASYEQVVQENEKLRNRGDDSLMASQWRQRYNEVLKEKDELVQKLRVVSRGSGYLANAISSSMHHSNNDRHHQGRSSTNSPASNAPTIHTATGTFKADAGGESSGPTVFASHVTAGSADSMGHYSSSAGSGSGSGGGGGSYQSDSQKSVEQLYLELRDEYRDFRRRAASLEQQRKQEMNELRRHVHHQQHHAGATSSTSSSSPIGERGLSSENNNNGSSDNCAITSSSSSSSSNAQAVNTLVEKKLAYIRTMVVQYLSCKDADVKKNIETALMAMFRFSAEEKSVVSERRAEEDETGVEAAAGVLGDYVGYGLSNLGSLAGIGR